MSATFIEISRIQDYHTTAAELAAILKEVYRDNPDAYMCELVEGGAMVFGTAADYDTWNNQT